MGNNDAVIILNSTGGFAQTNRTRGLENIEAAKILKSTNIMAPFSNKTATYTSTLKTLQNFYVKESRYKKWEHF